MPCSVPLLWQHTLADFNPRWPFSGGHLKRCANIMPEATVMIEEALAEQGFVDIERRIQFGY